LENLLEKALPHLGSSKYACFICYDSCEKLGFKTRGCDFDQITTWKMPNILDVDREQTDVLRYAVRQMNESMKAQLLIPLPPLMPASLPAGESAEKELSSANTDCRNLLPSSVVNAETRTLRDDTEW
jgi:hypothetical protein